MIKGMITDIQRFSLHDGPGIRTTVFLKGCNMRCAWCHNPETLDSRCMLEIKETLCEDCRTCFKNFVPNAHNLKPGNVHTVDMDKCIYYSDCINKCPYGAIEVIGKMVSVSEVYAEIEQDLPYYSESNGGVTVSGGEPFMQCEFLYELFDICKKNDIHTAVETNLSMPMSVIERVLDKIDLVIFDIKLFDDINHRKWTGVSNKQILNNATKLAKTKKPIIIRTPIIPSVNDDKNEIKNIVDFISEFDSLLYYELLPYNSLGEDKYKKMNMEYLFSGTRALPKTMMQKLVNSVDNPNIKIICNA